MKASLKFRENQNPILKSKIPLKIISFPFRSSIEASNDAKELCFSFSTSFPSGPLLKFNYRPKDPSGPFGLVLKTGVGSLGSPIGAPFTISVEYNFSGNNYCNKSPSFFLYFKPQIGDFAIRRRVISEVHFRPQSASKNDIVSEKSDEALEKMTWTKLISGGFAAAESFVGREEACARTVVPVKDWAAVKLRWGLRFPGEEGGWRTGKKMPFLVLNKMGIEQIWRGKMGREYESGSGGDVAETCLDIKKELNDLRSENEVLKKDCELLRREIGRLEI